MKVGRVGKIEVGSLIGGQKIRDICAEVCCAFLLYKELCYTLPPFIEACCTLLLYIEVCHTLPPFVGFPYIATLHGSMLYVATLHRNVLHIATLHLSVLHVTMLLTYCSHFLHKG